MNNRDKNPFHQYAPPQPAFDPSEWEQQERGLRAAHQADDAGLEALARDYRVVAHAVRSRPRSGPPMDFAASVARQAAVREAGIERLLSRWLVVTLVIVLGIVGVRYGAEVRASFQQALGDVASGWILIGLACAGLSWACARVQSFMAQDRTAHPSP